MCASAWRVPNPSLLMHLAPSALTIKMGLGKLTCRSRLGSISLQHRVLWISRLRLSKTNGILNPWGVSCRAGAEHSCCLQRLRGGTCMDVNAFVQACQQRRLRAWHQCFHLLLLLLLLLLFVFLFFLLSKPIPCRLGLPAAASCCFAATTERHRTRSHDASRCWLLPGGKVQSCILL